MKRPVLALSAAILLAALPASADAPAPQAPPPAPAAPRAKPTPADEAKAKQLFLAGNAAYKQTDYAGALTAFRAAYALDPRPGILFSMAQTMRRQYVLTSDVRLLREAEAAYRKYLAEVPEGGRRADAVIALGEIEPTLRASNVQVAPAPLPPAATATQIAIASQVEVDLTVSVDGGPPVKSSVVQVSPGKHALVISAEGYFDEKRAVDVPAGAVQSVDVQLKERPATLALKGAEGAELVVDGRSLGVVGKADVEIPHGRHLVALIQNGRHPWQEELELQRGVQKSVDVSLRVTGQRKVAFTLFGLGGAGLLTGGALLGAALAEQARAQGLLDKKASQNLSPDELASYASAVQNRDDLRLGAGVAAGAAAGVLGAGLLLYAFDRPTPEGPRRRDDAPEKPSRGPSLDAVVPFVGPGVAGLAVGGRF